VNPIALKAERPLAKFATYVRATVRHSKTLERVTRLLMHTDSKEDRPFLRSFPNQSGAVVRQHENMPPIQDRRTWDTQIDGSGHDNAQ
jgi:hypothetical protein